MNKNNSAKLLITGFLLWHVLCIDISVLKRRSIMKKVALLSLLTIVSLQVMAAPKESMTDTANDSICLTRSTDLKKKMKEVDELIAQSNKGATEISTDTKVISQ